LKQKTFQWPSIWEKPQYELERETKKKKCGLKITYGSAFKRRKRCTGRLKTEQKTSGCIQTKSDRKHSSNRGKSPTGRSSATLDPSWGKEEKETLGVPESRLKDKQPFGSKKRDEGEEGRKGIQSRRVKKKGRSMATRRKKKHDRNRSRKVGSLQHSWWRITTVSQRGTGGGKKKFCGQGVMVQKINCRTARLGKKRGG